MEMIRAPEGRETNAEDWERPPSEVEQSPAKPPAPETHSGTPACVLCSGSRSVCRGGGVSHLVGCLPWTLESQVSCVCAPAQHLSLIHI